MDTEFCQRNLLDGQEEHGKCTELGQSYFLWHIYFCVFVVISLQVNSLGMKVLL